MNRTDVLHMGDVDKAEKIKSLRVKISQVGSVRDFYSQGAYSKGSVHVMMGLSDILPYGGLPRGMITEMGDCPLLAAQLIAYCSAHGRRVAVIGWPQLSYAAIADLGADLSNIIAIPEPGGDVLHIAALVAEGMDMVICHNPTNTMHMSAGQTRGLMAKLRLSSAALIMVGFRIPGAHVVVNAQIKEFYGIGRGIGRIHGVELELHVAVKGRAPSDMSLKITSLGVSDYQLAHEDHSDRMLYAL